MVPYHWTVANVVPIVGMEKALMIRALQTCDLSSMEGFRADFDRGKTKDMK